MKRNCLLFSLVNILVIVLNYANAFPFTFLIVIVSRFFLFFFFALIFAKSIFANYCTL